MFSFGGSSKYLAQCSILQSQISSCLTKTNTNTGYKKVPHWSKAGLTRHRPAVCLQAAKYRGQVAQCCKRYDGNSLPCYPLDSCELQRLPLSRIGLAQIGVPQWDSPSHSCGSNDELGLWTVSTDTASIARIWNVRLLSQATVALHCLCAIVTLHVGC